MSEEDEEEHDDEGEEEEEEEEDAEENGDDAGENGTTGTLTCDSHTRAHNQFPYNPLLLEATR